MRLEPRMHAGVDDHTQLASILLQAQLGDNVLVWLLMTLLLPAGGVQDDLNASVHHARSLIRMRAALVELVSECPLFLHTFVVFPLPCLLIPFSEVDGETVNKSIGAFIGEETQRFL